MNRLFFFLGSCVAAVLLVAVFWLLRTMPPGDCPRSRFEGGSYFSQFYEDYILSAVFDDVGTGRYVDVGANLPDVGSVTKLFYERGWTGVNIDANPQFGDVYAERRPRDLNLTVGIAASEGTLTLYKISDGPGSGRFEVAGLSTFEVAIAEGHAEEGFRVREVNIPVQRLDKLLAQHEIGEVQFLNIDVEGFERQVLASVDFAVTRPWVVIIEATYPNTNEPVYGAWESVLIENDYVFALSDGLNRYYVHADHRDRLARFDEIGMCVRWSQERRGDSRLADGREGGP
jgi:FkbM family methyltransferase